MDLCVKDEERESGCSLKPPICWEKNGNGPIGLCNVGNLCTLTQRCVCVWVFLSVCVWVYQLGRVVGFLSPKYLNNLTIRGQLLLTSVTSGLHSHSVYKATNY